MSRTLIGEGQVLLELDDGVGHLRLNRPEASNGMDVPFLRALYDALMLAYGQTDLREARVVSELSGTADAREGLAAVIERRSPRFVGE